MRCCCNHCYAAFTRQALQVEGDDFFVDLVFYNYLLKCFVLIDLKVERLTHQDIGQMDMYVRLFEDKMKNEGDNPFCARKRMKSLLTIAY